MLKGDLNLSTSDWELVTSEKHQSGTIRCNLAEKDSDSLMILGLIQEIIPEKDMVFDEERKRKELVKCWRSCCVFYF